MHDHSTSSRRVRRAGAAALFAVLAPTALAAQTLGPGGLISPATACDFDIADELGRFVTGSVVHLVGRPGASSNRGDFVIINGASPEQDVDHDGYQVGAQCDYTDLFLPPTLQSPLVSVQNPSQAIPASNVILINLPRTLPNGTQARTEIYIEIPAGTPAGRYVGNIQVRDRIKFVSAVQGTNEVLGLDRLFIEVEVTEELGFQLVNADSARRLDSLIIRGRAGQRASGVLRVANIGNAPLSNVQLSSTDLRSESAVGLVIPAEQILFSTQTFSSLALTDTARITVTIQIPRGFLGGRYRGTLIAQGENAPRREIPLVVVVTSNRGILFGNNPVRSVNGDLGQIAFNGDPGTEYKLGIFDMVGLMVFEVKGTVFAGVGTAPNVIGADFAVNVIWPLVNGRGEAVASGMYLIVVESIVNGQRQLAQDKLIVIR